MVLGAVRRGGLRGKGGDHGVVAVVALAGAGLIAGFVNVMAGGGSLLTMPVMIFLGMTPATANGTNRIALLIQDIIAVDEFRRKGFSDARLSVTLALCTLPRRRRWRSGGSSVRSSVVQAVAGGGYGVW